MNKLYLSLLAVAVPAFAWAYTQPEQVRDQKAIYDEANGVVIVSGELPTVAYDSEYYVYEDLENIDQLVIERHTPGTGWPADCTVGTLENLTPGEVFSFTDTDVQPDAKYEYRIICYVDGVKGYAAYANVYTGVTPGALTLFSASTASPDATSIDFTVTAPSESATGLPLTSLTAIEIEAYEMWTYTLLHTFENVEPGQTYTWTLEGLEPGKTYYYRARARKGETGWGESIESQAYVGLDLPGKPVNFAIEPQGDEMVLLTWDHADKGLRGGSFLPDEVEYRVTRRLLDGEEIIAGISDPGATSFLDDHGFDEETIVEYTLTPINPAGEGYGIAESGSVIVGAPATLPFAESFANATFTHKGWTRETTQDDPYYTYTAWGSYSSGTAYHWGSDSYISISPEDNDFGFATCLFYSYSPEGQTEGLVSPRIAIGDQKNLDLSFYFYEFDTESSGNIVTASWRAEGGEWKEVFRSESEEDAIPGWIQAKLGFTVDEPTDNIQIRIEGIRGGIPIIDVFVDNILLTSDPSGIGTIGADSNSANTVAEYFTIDGRRLNAAPESGLYIEKRGTVTRKVIK